MPGEPLPGVELRIAEDGEILVRGPMVAGGRAGSRTGDLGRLDEDGRLTVEGRKADTIISGGENVAPARVEAALESHPGVIEAGVIGRPDPEWGEAVLPSWWATCPRRAARARPRAAGPPRGAKGGPLCAPSCPATRPGSCSGPD